MAVFSDIIKWFYEQLSNPIFSATLSGFIVFIMMYLEAKINKKEIAKQNNPKNSRYWGRQTIKIDLV